MNKTEFVGIRITEKDRNLLKNASSIFKKSSANVLTDALYFYLESMKEKLIEKNSASIKELRKLESDESDYENLFSYENDPYRRDRLLKVLIDISKEIKRYKENIIEEDLIIKSLQYAFLR